MSFIKQVPGVRPAGRAVLRGFDRIRRSLKPVRRAGRIVRHVLHYRAPDELASCPACHAPHPTPLMPIPLKGRSRTYGFASGCERCGLVFANPLPSTAQIEAAYSPEGEWGRHRQEEQEKQVTRGRIQRLFEPVRSVFDVVHPSAGASVLDFGCGLGGMLDAFSDLGWRTYGIEPAIKSAFARHRELEEIPRVPMFELAILHHVLEHVTDPLTILKRMGDAVRDGGLLLISVPNLDDVAVHGEMKYCIRSGVHVLAYTTTSLTWLLAEAGFTVMSSRSGPTQDRQNYRVLVARRTDGAVAKPGAPLDAARSAISRYVEARESRAALRFLPVRAQAAVLDLQRTEWRI